ncbi:hypothetical protein R6Q59_033202 [Mikania micrantha]
MPYFTTEVGKKSPVRSKCPSLPHYITTLIFNDITIPSAGKTLSKGSNRIVQTVIRIEKQSSKNILTKLEVMITLKEQRQNHQRAWTQMLGFGLLRSYLQLLHTINGLKQTQQIVQNNSMGAIMGHNLMHKDVTLKSKKPGLQNMLKVEGRCTAREAQVKIMDEKNKSMSSSGGDDTPVNEAEILER